MAKRKGPYFTLLQRHEGVWGIEFGDFDRETVEAELQDYRDHFIRKADLKIIRTADYATATIQPIVDALNGKAVSP